MELYMKTQAKRIRVVSAMVRKQEHFPNVNQSCLCFSPWEIPAVLQRECGGPQDLLETEAVLIGTHLFVWLRAAAPPCFLFLQQFLIA